MKILKLTSDNAYLLKYVMNNLSKGSHKIYSNLKHRYPLYIYQGNTINDIMNDRIDFYDGRCHTDHTTEMHYKGVPVTLDQHIHTIYYKCTDSFIRELYTYRYGLHWLSSDKDKCLENIKTNFPEEYERTIQMETELESMDNKYIELLIEQSIVEDKSLWK